MRARGEVKLVRLGSLEKRPAPEKAPLASGLQDEGRENSLLASREPKMGSFCRKRTLLG